MEGPEALGVWMQSPREGLLDKQRGPSSVLMDVCACWDLGGSVEGNGIVAGALCTDFPA